MPCRAARRLRKTLGRRGHFLLILGVGKTCWGVGMIVAPQSAPQGLRLLITLSPLTHWAWLWIVCGLITTGSAFLQVGRDRWGFVAALLPPTVWAVSYASAVVTGEFARGGFLAVWYLTSHVGVIMWASAVPEYSVPHVPRSRRGKGP
jgi:hypothetical protein